MVVLANLAGEIEREADRLRRLTHGLPDPEADERSVWSAYARTERTLALLKLQLSIERPGVAVKLPDPTADLRELLPRAVERLLEARDDLLIGKSDEAFEALRKGRNYLRVYLSEAGRRQRRQARSKRPSGASSRSSTS